MTDIHVRPRPDGRGVLYLRDSQWMRDHHGVGIEVVSQGEIDALPIGPPIPHEVASRLRAVQVRRQRRRDRMAAPLYGIADIAEWICWRARHLGDQVRHG